MLWSVLVLPTRMSPGEGLPAAHAGRSRFRQFRSKRLTFSSGRISPAQTGITNSNFRQAGSTDGDPRILQNGPEVLFLMIDLRKHTTQSGRAPDRRWRRPKDYAGRAPVLLLEAGPRLDPARDFLTAPLAYEMRSDSISRETRKVYLIRFTRTSTPASSTIEDPQHPYTTPENQPYTWFRSRCVGGKLLHWSRNAGG